MIKSVALFVLIMFSACIQAEQLVLRVEVLSQEGTDLYIDCKDLADDQVCIPFHFWYIYTAKILDVVSGDYSSEKIRFARLQHGERIGDSLKDVFVVLEDFENKTNSEQIGATAYASSFSVVEKVVCISDEMKLAFADKLEFTHAIDESSCFFLRDIDTVDELEDNEDT
ncbi:hypothetical protein [Glaciecola sp. MF2-115]|uniref:hypothetical protein n=1 Tax=Glaciecola sp. MF2-115 TaxID=3384827 RepID=UPI0039A1215B